MIKILLKNFSLLALLLLFFLFVLRFSVSKVNAQTDSACVPASTPDGKCCAPSVPVELGNGLVGCMPTEKTSLKPIGMKCAYSPECESNYCVYTEQYQDVPIATCQPMPTKPPMPSPIPLPKCDYTGDNVAQVIYSSVCSFESFAPVPSSSTAESTYNNASAICNDGTFIALPQPPQPSSPPCPAGSFCPMPMYYQMVCQPYSYWKNQAIIQCANHSKCPVIYPTVSPPINSWPTVTPTPSVSLPPPTGCTGPNTKQDLGCLCQTGNDCASTFCSQYIPPAVPDKTLFGGVINYFAGALAPIWGDVNKGGICQKPGVPVITPPIIINSCNTKNNGIAQIRYLPEENTPNPCLVPVQSGELTISAHQSAEVTCNDGMGVLLNPGLLLYATDGSISYGGGGSSPPPPASACVADSELLKQAISACASHTVCPTPIPVVSCAPRPACADADGKSAPICDPGPNVTWCPKSNPSCIPRPSCLDSQPKCMIAEPATGWCPPSASPPTAKIACDSNGDSKVDMLDFGIWKDEAILRSKPTKNADCNGDGKVDMLDFGIWKDIAILHKEKQ